MSKAHNTSSRPIHLRTIFSFLFGAFSKSLKLAAKAQNSNPTVAGECTVDTSAGAARKQRPAIPFVDPLSLRNQTLFSPAPWTPSDPIDRPVHQCKLLRLMLLEIQRLKGSLFYRRFLLQLRSPPVRDGLTWALASASAFNIVVYGVGSFELREKCRLQLALAFLLHRELGAPSAALEVFDPVFSATECAVAAALGFTVATVNEECRREVTAPTLFYMPFCEIILYDRLLQANWHPSRLNRMVVLGNSFAYFDDALERGYLYFERWGSHVLRATGFVREVEIVDEMEVEAVAVSSVDEAAIFRPFINTSWHFFRVRDERARRYMAICWLARFALVFVLLWSIWKFINSYWNFEVAGLP